MSYVKKKKMIAMLLAGGQGSRLGVLTNSVAKPAVPFGGKYRIIDFPLSNCSNSGIDTIGVLTQYQPLELNAYIGAGMPWDLDRLWGGVFILPPYVKGKSGEWYKGTANAIYQNLRFIELYDPEYVLILSGDHIYKMNYDMMLDDHIAKQADCSIAAIRVPLEEAGRFGVLNVREDLRIYEFEEKPPAPKSDLASMGVYIFTWDKLREFLIKDEADPASENDFGKNVLPAMLAAGARMFAYEFKGYWRDVGTIDSLWEANMDLLDPQVSLNLNDPPWKIYSRNALQPPQFIGEEAVLADSSISEGCHIEGRVEHSIIFPSVTVEKGAVVRNSILMPGAVVEEEARVEYAMVANNARVCREAVLGGTETPAEAAHPPIAVLGEGLTIGAGAAVPAGIMVTEDVKEEV
ncbi:MAG: glucose-1-phosphate adenylyltransferase [Bacillota bacterium]|nr:glucose-1-phosphate adenylyltransferase [Bacillota bacterium]